jgi:uncharacterized protein (TIGR00290 family)
MSAERIALSWSGGKDSALALFKIRSEGKYEVSYFLTTVTRDYGRVSMHGVREDLLREQVMAVSGTLDIAYISKDATNEEYEKAMSEKTSEYLSKGIRRVAFGDLFLEDIRKYREDKMSRAGMKCLFPLWGEDTASLARKFIDLGFKAIICTVDSRKLGREYAGREFDENFLSSLPPNVDACGENGEFHSFVYDGPIFDSPLRVKRGDIVERGNFYFSDILLDKP